MIGTIVRRNFISKNIFPPMDVKNSDSSSGFYINLMFQSGFVFYDNILHSWKPLVHVSATIYACAAHKYGEKIRKKFTLCLLPCNIVYYIDLPLSTPEVKFCNRHLGNSGYKKKNLISYKETRGDFYFSFRICSLIKENAHISKDNHG